MSQPNKEHPFGIHQKWWVLISIGAGTFMSALDVSVVNTILPVVQRDFSTNVATVEWVVIVYLLGVSGLLPGFGRLGDLIGHKSVYISGFLIFILSSLFCGFAPTVLALVMARALQSLGAAMLSANSPAILTKSFPSSQRGQALGMQATMTYLGLTIGPSLGGWLTDQLGWRYVFFINLPVGLTALLLSVRFIRRDLSRMKIERFDWWGAGLFMGGLVSLLLGLNQGHNWGWSSPAIIGLLAGSIILLVIFIRNELYTPSPMLDLRLFRNRTFSASVLAAILNYMCVYGIIFLMPFYLLQGRGLSPSQAGLLLTAQPIIMAIVAPISGTLSDRVGTHMPSAIGMAVLAAGLFFLSRLGQDSSNALIVLGLSATGLGIGIFISPNNSALMGSAPQARQGIAAGLLATSRNVGMVLGVGLAGAIFTTVISHSAPGDPSALFRAISTSFLIGIAIALVGMLVSALRGTSA